MTRFKDPINSVNYNKELFAFLKTIFPDTECSCRLEAAAYYNTKCIPSNPKVKASIIICPKPECNYRCVEHQEPLAELYLRHLKKVHHITPRAEFVENLKGKISYLRNNDRISYIDPYVRVQWENLLTAREMYGTGLPKTSQLSKAGARVCKEGALMFLLLGPTNYQACPLGVVRIGSIAFSIIPNNEWRALNVFLKIGDKRADPLSKSKHKPKAKNQTLLQYIKTM